MGRLTRRLEALERRRPTVDPCPEHQRPPAIGDIGTALRAFSPDAAERAAYLADQERLAATPSCRRCGWEPFVVVVQPAETWGSPWATSESA